VIKKKLQNRSIPLANFKHVENKHKVANTLGVEELDPK